MLIRNKVCYIRKKDRRLHKKELKKEESDERKKSETFKKLHDR